MTNQNIISALNDAQQAIVDAIASAHRSLMDSQGSLETVQQSIQVAQAMVGAVQQGAESQRLAEAEGHLMETRQRYERLLSVLEQEHREVLPFARMARDKIREHIQAILG